MILAPTIAVLSGSAQLLTEPFFLRALVAGCAVGLLSGLVGYFVVLRGQTFAGDALSHVAVAGAFAALAAGVDLRLGLFVATVAVAVGLGLLGPRGQADDVVIGTTFAWVLGLGVFFAAYATAHGSTGNGAAGVTVLFGSIFGISPSAATTAVLVALGLIGVLLLLARPLLFATLDPAVAAARGVPVRAVAVAFLVVVGASAAEVSQAVGALLLFGLLAAPPAAAQLLTVRPWAALALSGALAVAAVLAGLVLAAFVGTLPPSFAIIAVATGEYAVAGVLARWRRRRGPRVARVTAAGRGAVALSR